MSDDAEQQAEEIEVLKSIYEGDDNFKQLDPKTYQYKYIDGEKSFILEISWGPTYPTEKPTFNLEIFYNQHLVPAVKEKILSIVNEEAEQWVGCAMTYTLFECLKEKVAEILSAQAEEAVIARVEKIAINDPEQGEKKTTDKKEQLTKAQKRRAWDRAEMGRGGEKPRGWDWVDIVKHLSQVYKWCMKILAHPRTTVLRTSLRPLQPKPTRSDLPTLPPEKPSGDVTQEEHCPCESYDNMYPCGCYA